MKYSKAILTDDNFDYEREKLEDKVGFDSDEFNKFAYSNFVEKLDDKFTLQFNDDLEAWIACGSYPDKGSDFTSVIQKGQLAYEFGNGFMVFDYEIVIL